MNDYDSLRKMLPVANERTGTVTIKGICDRNIRRIPILQTPTYNELCFMLHRMFREELSANLDNLVLFYRDEDDDQVLITDDMDISHALTHSSVLRITVYDKEVLPPPNSKGDLSKAVKQMVFSSANKEVLKSNLENIRNMIDTILTSLPDDNDATSRRSSTAAAPKTKPLSTADMAEFLDSGHQSAQTTKRESNGLAEGSVTPLLATGQPAQQQVTTKPDYQAKMPRQQQQTQHPQQQQPQQPQQQQQLQVNQQVNQQQQQVHQQQPQAHQQQPHQQHHQQQGNRPESQQHHTHEKDYTYAGPAPYHVVGSEPQPYHQYQPQEYRAQARPGSSGGEYAGHPYGSQGPYAGATTNTGAYPRPPPPQQQHRMTVHYSQPGASAPSPAPSPSLRAQQSGTPQHRQQHPAENYYPSGPPLPPPPAPYAPTGPR